MHKTNLHRVGGSIMLAVPPVLLDMLQLEVGETVGIAVEGRRLVVESSRRPRYTIADLLAGCNPDVPRTQEETEWLDDTPAGSEII